jgi:septum site-determining protein MinC
MGIEGARPSLLGPRHAARDERRTPGLRFRNTRSRYAGVRQSPPTATAKPIAVPSGNRAASVPSIIVTEPVRSGQSLMFEGDITVVGSVASGAEVVAGGSIHIYGTLRGRAAAGSMGDETARIFCRKLEAELIAIGGYYKTSEDIEPELRGRAVHFWLEGDSLLAETLG